MGSATSERLAKELRGRSGRRARRGFVGVCLATAIVLIQACSLYNEMYRPESPPSGGEPEVHFVEADDEGWFWNPAQAKNALTAVKEAADAGDVVLVTFVHGWHHRANCCDNNLAGFREVLLRLSGQLDREMYDVARQQIHGAAPSESVRVIGIFVGWRGRSLPGWLDYLTFWGRKSSAERVGESDLQEFLVRLRNLHEARQQPPSGGTHYRSNLFGMVTIGHSFGGQVVLRATSSYLEHKLTLANDAPGYLRDATSRPSNPTQLQAPISGFGDLVVLINPAVEAAAYQRIHALSRLAFPQEQWPLMLTLSAYNDRARQGLFRWGRIAGEIFTRKPRVEKRQRELERNSLGFFREQVTHTLQPVDTQQVLTMRPLKHRRESTCPKCQGRTFEWYDWKSKPDAKSEPDSLSAELCGARLPQPKQQLSDAVASIQQHDFSQRTVFSDVVLDVKDGAPHLPHQAFIVASVAPNVIDGHNGMFSRPLMDFLTTYIAFAEAKRLLPNLPAAVIPDLRSCYEQATE